MKISEKIFKILPSNLQAIFEKLPNPGSEEVVGLFPSPHGAGSKLTQRQAAKKWKHTSDGMFPLQSGARFGDSGSAARFFYCAKASRADRGKDNNHPTVKPISLMRYLCRLVTPPGGIVLDPFMGSGSTGVAAKMERFSFIGIEIDKKYCKIAEKRIEIAELEEPLLDITTHNDKCPKFLKGKNNE